MRRFAAVSMRCVWLLCIALAGSAISERSTITINLGEDFTLSAQTNTNEVGTCFIITPALERINLLPENEAPTRFVLQTPGHVFGCAVVVTQATTDDSGVWEIHATTAAAEVTHEFAVSVLREAVDLPLDDEEGVKWLPRLNFTIQIGSEVSIALSKQEYEEECFVRAPDGNSKSFSDAEKVGIQTFGSNKFVACRIVIGPIDGTQQGTWALCGTHYENEVKVVRCQAATLNWHFNSPSNTWEPEVRQTVDHVVNYGMTLTPTLSDFGQPVTSCHVITPSGDDLQVTENSDYNGVIRLQSAADICRVAIGPIQEGFIGNWTLYATFTSSGIGGISEIHQPMQLFLYDENNPYKQAYNVSTLDAQRRIVNLGTTISHEITSSGQTDSCYVKTPSGQLLDVDSASSVEGISLTVGEVAAACEIAIGPISETMMGEWNLIGKFTNNDLFTELHQTINIIQEDPSNPAEDYVVRSVINLMEELFETKLGASHIVSIERKAFASFESCHIITPTNLQYKIMDGFNVDGVQVLEGDDNCGVIIKVIAEDMVGEWTLFTRGTFLNDPYEWRQSFIISVEETVGVIPGETYIAEGNDLYIRLENPTDQFETCKLLAPDGNQAKDYQYDRNYPDACGYIVNNIQATQSGNWTIVFGSTISYRATSRVNVVDRWQNDYLHLTWTQDRPVNETIGPEDAIYCRIEDQNGLAVFEGFGRCSISLTRATPEHSGVWRMIVGTPGRVLTDEHEFTVTVETKGSRSTVVTDVRSEDSDLLLSCTLSPEGREIRACKFRDPAGRLLLINSGVGEDRYVSHGAEGSVESTLRNQTCGLRVNNIKSSDLGVWRCAMETEDDETYFGFVTVNFSWVQTTEEEMENIVKGPTLTADRQTITAVEGDSVTMYCSIARPILYCYFRFRNGTTFTAGYAGRNGSAEYAGAGLDAGECAIRFTSLRPQDSGAWSCHVGFDDNLPEQQASFQVEIQEKLSAVQSVGPDDVLHIEVRVHGERPITYCRFVRIDGFGFTGNYLPNGYFGLDDQLLSKGVCGLSIPNPSIVEVHPWTVAVKLESESFEISRQTMGSFPDEPAPPPPPQWEHRRRPFGSFLIMIMVFITTIFVIGALVGPKKNREWARSRVVYVRRSFRNSIYKTTQRTVNNTTNMAA